MSDGLGGKSGHPDRRLSSAGLQHYFFPDQSKLFSALRVNGDRNTVTILNLRSSLLRARQCSVASWPEQRHQARLPIVREVLAIREPGRPERGRAVEADPRYCVGVVETGTAERDAGERRGCRAFTVTVRMGDSGRGVLLAI